ncbi:MAG: hypothetical protein A2X87_08315 [Deltaproteobacteria bacterium GWC2_42_51]|nr:MAG: hypothetical protein A2056_00605 [Deltaproteobacteria bacterium GWA2_42_85]OGP23043.1 MAG: hypothetical protein A2067_08970 [Deltaproteobacteria bacterium GWB2_42_7]OGP34421.1 MAG: hypothetical protein A2X87_08315 [Deltaproteobacteria bacterium GWC2_42_51]OGP41241.1 MAG: hypothetical protein A2090_08630 [Deltaproteobacteria bacterium GWD2_42_10]OGQ25065.1 MAG: hypothetical protein A3D29_05160 [Deltaproteobacteria bacterium RIFCSPHIGHO2_02_FULL_42_44]OGQ36786.1 MAG: hypothetical protein
MTIDELYQYAYIKQPLHEIYPTPSSVPQEFIIEWLKDKYDYERMHSDEELKEFLKLTPEQILNWLEEAAVFIWEAKRQTLSP